MEVENPDAAKSTRNQSAKSGSKPLSSDASITKNIHDSKHLRQPDAQNLTSEKIGVFIYTLGFINFAIMMTFRGDSFAILQAAHQIKSSFITQC